MSQPAPDVELLRAYFHGDLSPEEQAEVRRWLIVHAGPEELSLCEALVRERDERQALLSSCVEHPLRGRLERAFWRVRSRLGHRLATLVEADEERRLAFARLGRASTTQPVFEVPLGTPVDLRLKLSVACHVAAYAVVSWKQLVALPTAKALQQSGTLELPGFELEHPDDVLDLYVVFDTAGTPPLPGQEDGPAWLAELLARLETHPTAWVLRRTFMPVPPVASPGA